MDREVSGYGNRAASRCRTTPCSRCAIRRHCLPAELEGEHLGEFEHLVRNQVRICKGDVLYLAGDDFTALYAIRIGSMKTSAADHAGREQVVACNLMGEIIGIDGIATSRHTCSALALEDCDVCVFPFERLDALGEAYRSVRRRVQHALAREVVRVQELVLMLASSRAEQRVAALLLDLSERYERLGYSARDFVLRLRREEIGSYLGMQIETVSRAFSRLHLAGLIRAQGREIKLLDAARLRMLVAYDAHDVYDANAAD